ncbi:MAG TPA: nicotinate-nicotinamide nucleotide adenylyltransferase [Blastocatellia bacterium]|jgi:nicotinic acid mononucleotide adenylyltransferase|nr:nicotinate-nicotinamide nucleotide adenylyltransferase [Blastocatellia bacterium]
MGPDHLRKTIERVGTAGEPRIELIKRAEVTGPRLGVFAASFNPITVAHTELMRRAASQFSLDETLALAGKTNADKNDYECPLEERLHMLALTLAGDASTSIGLSSHAYYVDMLAAIERAYPPGTHLHFIVGFDTFERVLDPGERYTAKYFHRFDSRADALRHLLGRSRLIVAGRAGAGYGNVRALVEREQAELGGRVWYLDFPADLGERSATEVRCRTRAGESIAGLVPRAVEDYIHERGLYR